MKIFANDIRLRAFHGALPQERIVGGDFLVSVVVEVENEKSTETDELSDTVNYAEICRVVREEMAIPSQLLEHVCGRIARRLLHDFPLLSHAAVRVTKLNPPIVGIQCNGSGVEVSI